MAIIQCDLVRRPRHAESCLVAISDGSWKVFVIAPLTLFTASDVMIRRVRKKRSQVGVLPYKGLLCVCDLI